jgi:hypothetical protein
MTLPPLLFTPAVIKITGMQVELDIGKVDAAHMVLLPCACFVRMACTPFLFILVIPFLPLYLYLFCRLSWMI